MIDYHVHTPLCNHAKNGMESYVRRGVALGLRDICFLDHLTLPERENGQSMRPNEVSLYFQGIQTLKNRYSGQINVKAGLEIDFNPDYTEVFNEIIDTFSFDVIGISLHSPAGQDVVSRSSAWGHGEFDTDYIYDLYMTELDKMLDFDYFDILCHLDLPKKFGRIPSQPIDDRYAEILRKIKDKNLTVEINTSGYDHTVGEIYPSREIIVQCHDFGIPITLGSDAHAPERIGMHYDRVLPILTSAGYRDLSVFTKRKRTEVPITS